MKLTVKSRFEMLDIYQWELCRGGTFFSFAIVLSCLRSVNRSICNIIEEQLIKYIKATYINLTIFEKWFGYLRNNNLNTELTSQWIVWKEIGHKWRLHYSRSAVLETTVWCKTVGCCTGLSSNILLTHCINVSFQYSLKISENQSFLIF